MRSSLTVREAVLEYGDIDAKQLDDRDLALPYARSIGLYLPTDIGYGKLLMEIFENPGGRKGELWARNSIFRILSLAFLAQGLMSRASLCLQVWSDLLQALIPQRLTGILR